MNDVDPRSLTGAKVVQLSLALVLIMCVRKALAKFFLHMQYMWIPAVATNDTIEQSCGWYNQVFGGTEGPEAKRSYRFWAPRFLTACLHQRKHWTVDHSNMCCSRSRFQRRSRTKHHDLLLLSIHTLSCLAMWERFSLTTFFHAGSRSWAACNTFLGKSRE